MTVNISAVNKSNNSFNFQKGSLESSKEFPKLNDPISEAICKNVKDPTDREEDLLFWKNFCDSGVKLNKSNPTYEDFLNLKKNIVCFPPQTAPGSVRKEYREYMNKLPKSIRDNMQGILTLSYGLFISDSNMKQSSWEQTVNEMKQHVGEIGDVKITDFNLLDRILNDCSAFGKPKIEDESVRQILV